MGHIGGGQARVLEQTTQASEIVVWVMVMLRVASGPSQRHVQGAGQALLQDVRGQGECLACQLVLHASGPVVQLRGVNRGQPEALLLNARWEADWSPQAVGIQHELRGHLLAHPAGGLLDTADRLRLCGVPPLDHVGALDEDGEAAPSVWHAPNVDSCHQCVVAALPDFLAKECGVCSPLSPSCLSPSQSGETRKHTYIASIVQGFAETVKVKLGLH